MHCWDRVHAARGRLTMAAAVLFAIFVLAARILLEYLSAQFSFLTDWIIYINYTLYATVAIVAIIIVIDLIRFFMGKKISFVSSVIATVAVGVVYFLFQSMADISVIAPWVPYLGYAFLGFVIRLVIVLMYYIVSAFKRDR